jgi:hypothetical protein
MSRPTQPAQGRKETVARSIQSPGSLSAFVNGVRDVMGRSHCGRADAVQMQKYFTPVCFSQAWKTKVLL